MAFINYKMDGVLVSVYDDVRKEWHPPQHECASRGNEECHYCDWIDLGNTPAEVILPSYS